MCNFLVHLLLKKRSVKTIVVRKLDAKVKELMNSLCVEDNANKNKSTNHNEVKH